MTQDSGAPVVARFVRAWLAGDLDGVMACVTDDVVYAPPGSGELVTYRGREAVRDVFAASVGPDADLTLGEVVVAGDVVLGPWWYPPREDGSTFRGLDLYTLRDGMIAAKDVFSKITRG